MRIVTDDVTIILENGMVLRSRVANLPKGKRTSKEPEVMKLKEGDAVASIARMEAQKAESRKQKAESAKKEKEEGEVEQLALDEIAEEKKEKGKKNKSNVIASEAKQSPKN